MKRLLGSVDPDGYRQFSLPEFGSGVAPIDQQVNELCDAWYVAEVDFIKRLMRPAAGSRGIEAQRFAAAATALAYFQAVRNGNGIARYVREHLKGSAPIREPKGLFIRTIELHRTAAVRESMQESRLSEREVRTSFDDHDASVPMARTEAADSSHSPELEARVAQCIRIRSELLEIATKKESTPDVVEAKLSALQTLCAEDVDQRDMLASLTDRQRLVFLLRVDPLSAVDGTALEYQDIATISWILGRPTSVGALRQSLREALMRLRVEHSTLRDELGHG